MIPLASFSHPADGHSLAKCEFPTVGKDNQARTTSSTPKPSDIDKRPLTTYVATPTTGTPIPTKYSSASFTATTSDTPSASKHHYATIHKAYPGSSLPKRPNSNDKPPTATTPTSATSTPTKPADASVIMSATAQSRR